MTEEERKEWEELVQECGLDHRYSSGSPMFTIFLDQITDLRDKNERQAEVVRSFGNSLEKAMTENSALRSSLAEKEEEIKRLREENQAFEYELKCFHDGNNGNDNH